MTHAQLFPLLKAHTEEFARQADALDVSCREDKHRYSLRVELHTAALEFVFTKRERLQCPPHTLFCRVYPLKNQPHGYHLPELWEVLEQPGFPPFCFPYIENAGRLAACFAQLAGILVPLLPAVERLAPEESALWERSCRTLQALWGEGSPSGDDSGDRPEPKEEPSELFWESARTWFEACVLLPRLTCFPGWRAYAEGDYPNALALYEKLGPLLPFEQRLTEFMRSAPAPVPVYAPGCDAAPEALTRKGGNLRDFGMLLLCWLTAYLLAAVPFTLLSAAVRLLFSHGSLYAAGMPWYGGLLFAGLPAVFGGIAFRRPLWRLLRRRELQKELDMDSMLTSPRANRFGLIVFGISAAASIAGTVLLGLCGVRFYEDRLEYFETPRLCRVCPYARLTAVYYAQARENSFGDRIDRPSYILEFADGFRLDLDEYLSPAETRDRVLPLLPSRLPVTPLPLLPFSGEP